MGLQVRPAHSRWISSQSRLARLVLLGDRIHIFLSIDESSAKEVLDEMKCVGCIDRDGVWLRAPRKSVFIGLSPSI